MRALPLELDWLAQLDDEAGDVMADRRVTRTGKYHGDITSLCNPGEGWSPRASADAIRDIETGAHTYYVQWTDKRTEVHVAKTGSGTKYLRTDWDDTVRNNLDDLDDC